MGSVVVGARKELRYPRVPVRVKIVHSPEAQVGIAPIWQPFPGPQTDAYNSEADIIGYGGAGGGGKTDLALGFAGTKHRQSIIFRREFPQTRDMIERSRAIYNNGETNHAKDSYNESLHIWRLGSKRIVEFGSCQYEKDKENYRGRPHDLYVFDEATQFSESIVRFVTAWNRTTIPGQKCRILLTFNPPTDTAGRWVITFFLPWMAFLFPELEECKAYRGTPATPGEVRWYVVDAGKDVEVPEGTPKARSRTFFPARVEDNPSLMAQGYDATLESLPEPLRSQMRFGSFTAGMEADPWQVIPTAWVRAAQARWTPRETPGRPLAVGMDVAWGGKDQTVIARAYDHWYAELMKKPGVETPDGPTAAALVLPFANAIKGIYLDIIGGGGRTYDALVANNAKVTGINNASSAGNAHDSSGKLTFRNLRAASYWKLREDLDPDSGKSLALPPDAELLADLTTPRWSVTTGGVLIESKEQIKDRIGRSPDCGDAVVLAHWGATRPVQTTDTFAGGTLSRRR